MLEELLGQPGYQEIVVLLQLHGADLISKREFRKNLKKFCKWIELDD